jgi:hypothetical protein
VVGDVIPFSEIVRRAVEAGGEPNEERVVVVALDDALYERLPAIKQLPRLLNGFVMRYVPASQAVDPDVTLAAYEPSHPSCVQLFQCADGELYEQDDSGLIYASGVPIWPKPPLAFGAPRSLVCGELHQGEEAALLFFEAPSPREARIRIRLSPPIARVVRLPVAPWAPFTRREWLSTARMLLTARDEAEDDLGGAS